MATNTTNYKLVKPSENEYYDINISNSNLDIIDTEIKKIDAKFNNISTDAKGTKFDNSTNGMASTTVQGAIEENKTNIETNKSNITTLNNNVSALTNKVNNSQITKLTTDTGTCISIPNGNLNDITTTGFYMGDTPANSPITGWVYVEAKVHNVSYQNQVLTNLHDSTIRYTRHKTSGSWSAWGSL